MQRIRYVDSHTAGEPTRLVLDGFPDLTALPLRERVKALRTQHDRYRAALVSEPRASDVVVGAFLMPPVEPANSVPKLCQPPVEAAKPSSTMAMIITTFKLVKMSWNFPAFFMPT